ncbi:MAG: hypothetical protein QXP04_01210 [Candidatus Nanoarchaeia archaeon]|nr:hypothetical protein [Candidatus Jingweiarchaeum tengchongense]
MPRLVFRNLEDLIAFCESFVKQKPDNFILIVSEAFEIIVHQTVSTRPIFIGYLKFEDPKNFEETIVSLQKNYGLRTIRVESLEWDIEKPVGIKFTP